ncbi:hypothetical protein WJX81_001751 [Elliptochloris bilobata]|uniref:Prenylcysteine lyase domain-containing protein n=1 Tax=Elliptochloris bilobata TaxID=381761 RepID=A0AAW1S1Y4_9CHLO
MGASVHLDVFEASNTVGGRTQFFHYENQTYELGASILHEQNQYFRDYADKLAKEDGAPTQRAAMRDGGPAAVYDGRRFVFNESDWTVVNLYNIMRRYGLSYFWLRSAPRSMLQRYLRLYELEREGRAYETPEALLGAVGLHKATQRSLRAELKARVGVGKGAQRLAAELVAGINHVQYNQGNDINAFAGMVSLLPTIDGRLFRLEKGNARLPAALLGASGANVTRARVTEIARQRDGTFSLSLRPGGRSAADEAEEVVGGYAAVVLATPLERSGGLCLKGVGPAPRERRFQRTVTTFVRGRLDPAYFGVARLPAEYILTAEGAGTPFSVISRLRTFVDGSRLYKLFSAAPMADAQLAALFRNASRVAEHDWAAAYPVFGAPEGFAPFQLAEGLMYVSAWENAASAMEMAAVAARNCALLVQRHLHRLAGGAPASAPDPGAASN